MKNQRKPRITAAWQTLGIVFTMLFVMAFACDNDRNDNSRRAEIETDNPPGNTNPNSPANTDVLTEAMVKKLVTAKVNSAATSYVRSVTVTFESVRFTEPLTARIAGQYGDNHYKGAVVYPVRVKFTIVRQYAGSPDEMIKGHKEFDIYKNYYGEWDYQKARDVEE